MKRETSQECKTCEFYRWIAAACALDLDAIHDEGLTCTQWEPIRLRQRKTPT